MNFKNQIHYKMLRKAFAPKIYLCSYYKTLKVKQDASQEEIKKSFLDLAKKHHPDSGTISDCQFIKIKQAYDTLRDPDSRSRYDFQLIHGPYHQRQRMHYYYHSNQESEESAKITSRGQMYNMLGSLGVIVMGYYLIKIYLTPMTQHQIRRQNLILSRQNYDSSPSVQEKRRKMFMQQMKQKKISTKVVELKLSTSAQQTTKAKNIRKNTIHSIPGISKQKQQEAPVNFDQYI